MRTTILACLLLLTQLAGRAQAGSNLLHNGSFEHGNFGGWQLSGNTQYSQVFNQTYDGLSPHGGRFYALLGPQGADGTLSQSFADTAGDSLTLSFWLASDGGATDAFTAAFDGATFLDLTDTGAFGWHHYTDTVTATGHDTISFSFLDDQDYFALDSVHVTELPAQGAAQPGFQAASFQGGPIPEPATLLLLPAAVIVLALRRSRARSGHF